MGSRVLIAETIVEFGYDPRGFASTDFRKVWVECQGDYCNKSKRITQYKYRKRACRKCAYVDTNKLSGHSSIQCAELVRKIKDDLKDPRIKGTYLSKKYGVNINFIHNIKYGHSYNYIK